MGLTMVVFSRDAGGLVLGAMLAAIGIYLLRCYRNWWFILGEDAIDFQTWDGKRKSIRYTDIVHFEIVDSRVARTNTRQPCIVIESADGTSIVLFFHLASKIYDLSPLTARAYFAHTFGHWPTREEFARYAAAEQARAFGQPNDYDRTSYTGVGTGEDGGTGEPTHPQSPAPSSDSLGSHTPTPFSQPKRRSRRGTGRFS
ncbi:MAG: hypothetical protein Q3979_03910 [Actinomycetaceae bacterium]|nr:hypothetical protein [Actinomycetaceae bacterium]